MKRVIATAAVLFALCASDVALALAQQTFVASTGSDTWPCSRTQPCRSFAAAIGQTNSGGEVALRYADAVLCDLTCAANREGERR